MVPKSVLIDAGKHYLKKQKRSLGVSEEEIIHIAVKSLGLDDLSPFKYRERVIEFMLDDENQQPLNKMTIREFANETAAESPAPGGGSISAYIGALGASLGTMVANLSANKRGWEDRLDFFSEMAEKGQQIKEQLLALVDEDTAAFNKVMAAFAMPKTNEEETKKRKEAIESANIYAAEVPLKVMQTAFSAFEMLRRMTTEGNPSSITDGTVGALCVRTAIEGAYLNILTNVSGISNAEKKALLVEDAEHIMEHARREEKEIVDTVYGKLKK
jgi:glutamate formiminotransferase/formiminotetrahydrofolate cyclodeaminase